MTTTNKKLDYVVTITNGSRATQMVSLFGSYRNSMTPNFGNDPSVKIELHLGDLTYGPFLMDLGANPAYIKRIRVLNEINPHRKIRVIQQDDLTGPQHLREFTSGAPVDSEYAIGRNNSVEIEVNPGETITAVFPVKRKSFRKPDSGGELDWYEFE